LYVRDRLAGIIGWIALRKSGSYAIGVEHMHTTSPDLVAIKTAVRQLTSRLENEARSTAQWAALAKNRGVGEVSVRLESVVASLESALANARVVPDLLFEAQEQEEH
jgi:hypothetical protein